MDRLRVLERGIDVTQGNKKPETRYDMYDLRQYNVYDARGVRGADQPLEPPTA